MSRITPLMTSLHEGHKAEERLKCIDKMLFKKCEDTKDTILQAFWWYRKHSIPLTKVKQAKLEAEDIRELTKDGWKTPRELKEEFIKILDKLISESEGVNGTTRLN